MDVKQGTPVVWLDRPLLFRFLIFLLPLFWPLLVFGQPSYISDSISYWKGGEKIASVLLDKAAPQRAAIVPTATGAVSAVKPVRGAQEVVGVRSITYSAVTYLLQWPGHSMVLLIVFQLAACAFFSAVAASALGVRSLQWIAGIAAALACLTPLAVFGSNAIPDVLHGVVAGTYILFFVALDRLSRGVRVVLALIGVFAITSHASTPPVIFGLILLFGLLMLWRWRRWRVPLPWPVIGWTVIPFLVAMGVISAGNRVAFGSSDVYAKRYPLALARSISDGPARWYLERECPTAHYAVCEVFGTHYPTTVAGFVFEDRGLAGRATAEQMDRIRAEEYEIVRRAALAYPFVEGGNFANHVLRQLGKFGYRTAGFDTTLATRPDGSIALVPTGVNYQPQLHWLDIFCITLALACIAGSVLLFRRFDLRQRWALALLVPMMLGNSVVVVVFSGIIDRYQARVVWLLPLFALSALATLRAQQGSAEKAGVRAGQGGTA